MPKILVYISAKITWIFLFWGTDFNENRAHVHVGKKGTDHLCKIWLEPEVTIEESGSLTENQQKQVLELAVKYQNQMLKQWKIFKTGKKVKMITINE